VGFGFAIQSDLKAGQCDGSEIRIIPAASPHYSSREFAMRTSEPKPHEINKLLVSFDSEVRK
jgi:Ni,Fe-hydrogenase III small subunit